MEILAVCVQWLSFHQHHTLCVRPKHDENMRLNIDEMKRPYVWHSLLRYNIYINKSTITSKLYWHIKSFFTNCVLPIRGSGTWFKHSMWEWKLHLNQWSYVWFSSNLRLPYILRSKSTVGQGKQKHRQPLKWLSLSVPVCKRQWWKFAGTLNLKSGSYFRPIHSQIFLSTRNVGPLCEDYLKEYYKSSAEWVITLGLKFHNVFSTFYNNSSCCVSVGNLHVTDFEIQGHNLEDDGPGCP